MYFWGGQPMASKVLKSVFQWGIAVAVGFFIINFVCFFYRMPARGKMTPNGASISVSQPNTISVHGKEGYSISKSDRNGFANPNKELAEKYILMLGASHTVAAEIASNKKYSVLVDQYYNDSKYLHTYNIANSGHFLPSQIEHFKAAMEAYPNAEAVTIEIFSTDYSAEEINASMNQVEYDPNQSVLIYTNGSTFLKLKTWIRYFLPMIEVVISQKNTIINARTPSIEFEFDENEYSESINEALALLRSEYEGPLVFVYHPKTELNKDGSLTIEYSKTWNLFYKACLDNSIDVIDSGDDFLKYYESNHRLPYGFSNTSLGKGHLNELGHRILADEIIDYLEEVK